MTDTVHVRFTASVQEYKHTSEARARCPKCGRLARWLHVSIVDGRGKYTAEHEGPVLHRGRWTKAMEKARR